MRLLIRASKEQRYSMALRFQSHGTAERGRDDNPMTRFLQLFV